MNQYKNIRFQLEEMCVPQSVSPQSSLHSWVSSQLWSHSGPGGSLHGDSSHLRLPPLFLHQAGGRQQSKQGLATEVRTICLELQCSVFNLLARTLALWERVYCTVLIIIGIAGGCIATGIAVKNIFNSCMSVPCYISHNNTNNCTLVERH